jgi:hypothetical protein
MKKSVSKKNSIKELGNDSLIEDTIDPLKQLEIKLNNKKSDDISPNINDLKKNSNDKILCSAAVRYTTFRKAYKVIESGHNVYLIKEEKNGIIKTSAYSQCLKTCHNENEYCHIHCRMILNNPEDLKIFKKDILPTGNNDKTRALASVNDSFFENMGKRGAKKKNYENNFCFPSENDPILLILNHKNAKLQTVLYDIAKQLLKSNHTDIHFKPLKKQEEPIEKNMNNNLQNKISLVANLSNLKSNTENVKIMENTVIKEEDDFSIKEDEFDNEEDDYSVKDNQSDNEEDDLSIKEDHSDSEEDSSVKDNESENDRYESDNDEDESDNENTVQCIEIKTIDNISLYLDPDDNKIYQPSEEEEDGEEIGYLKEISKKYHQIKYNDKLYTVMKEFDHVSKGKIYCCVLSNLLFDKKSKKIGKRIKIKGNEYTFQFD